MRKVMVLAVAALLGVAAGCGGNDDDAGASDKLVVYSGREEELVEPLFDRFERGDRDRRRGALRRQRRARGDDRRGRGQLPRGRLLRAGPRLARGGRARRAAREAAQATHSTGSPAHFRDPDGHWVGTSGRSRVIAYNTDALTEDEVPDSVFDLTDPKWKGKIGIAPTNASFQAFVSAMRLDARRGAHARVARGR